jgi:hypothetical protein
MTIFTRHGLYLNAFYKWGIIPHLFEWWRFRDVLEMMMACKDRPTGYAVVKPGVIDLDRLKVVRL